MAYEQFGRDYMITHSSTPPSTQSQGDGNTAPPVINTNNITTSTTFNIAQGPILNEVHPDIELPART